MDRACDPTRNVARLSRSLAHRVAIDPRVVDRPRVVLLSSASPLRCRDRGSRAARIVGNPGATRRGPTRPTTRDRSRRRSRRCVAPRSSRRPGHARRRWIGEFWDTGQGEREGAGPAYASLLAALRARGVPIVRPDALCGRPRQIGRATLEVLAPCPEPAPFTNPNDNSFVIRVRFGRRAVLLVGDAEHAEEEGLLQGDPAQLRADFLKVGHHGSATSSSAAFVAAVGAPVAAISCGVRNRFGHPHPNALRTLMSRSSVLRTDRNGSIRWATDGTTVGLVTAGQGEVDLAGPPDPPAFSPGEGQAPGL